MAAASALVDRAKDNHRKDILTEVFDPVSRLIDGDDCANRPAIAHPVCFED